MPSPSPPRHEDRFVPLRGRRSPRETGGSSAGATPAKPGLSGLACPAEPACQSLRPWTGRPPLLFRSTLHRPERAAGKPARAGCALSLHGTATLALGPGSSSWLCAGLGPAKAEWASAGRFGPAGSLNARPHPGRFATLPTHKGNQFCRTFCGTKPSTSACHGCCHFASRKPGTMKLLPLFAGPGCQPREFAYTSTYAPAFPRLQ